MSPLTGNKGEWSEFYVLLMVLANGFLHIGGGSRYPVTSVFDTSSGPAAEFRIVADTVEVLDSDQRILAAFSQSEARVLAELVFRTIRSSSGAFYIPDAEAFMAANHISGLHTAAAGKTDIELEVYDARTHSTLRLGFSIKSLVGSKPTLFNADHDNTNFVYELVGLEPNAENVRTINSIDGSQRYRDRVGQVAFMGGRLAFHDVAGGILSLNLQVIDSWLPEILAAMIAEYYSGAGRSIATLVARLVQTNPCGFDQTHGHRYYERKVKAFLRDAALGMTATSLWSGELQTTGGYVVVDADGALECTHAYDMSVFEDYLFRCTSLDGPSGSRHGYGEAYLGSGRILLKLPLQVRFTG